MKNLVRRSGRFLFGRVLPRLAYPVVSGPLRSSRFILGSMAGDGGGASVYFNKMEPEQTESMHRELNEGDVFFDIGANVGYYSILASKLVGKDGSVIACEPVIRNLAFLQQHVVLNKAENVRILAFACSSENGTARFSLGPNSAMGQLTRGGEADVLVPTLTLDTIAQEMDLLPDVLKIDVEGAEFGVLQGAMEILKRRKPTIFLSTHSIELREACLNLLKEIGYKTEPLIGGNEPHEFLAKAS
jgi:FkbM family methyltransferase